jgi:hypothetical protein
MDKCSYFECENEICDSEKMSNGEMKFCQFHLERLNRLIDTENAPGIVSFWIASYGGAKRMAHVMLHGTPQ